MENETITIEKTYTKNEAIERIIELCWWDKQKIWWDRKNLQELCEFVWFSYAFNPIP